MPVSEQQKMYVKKHQQEKTDTVTIRPPKGSKERWRAAASANGVSLQRFIIDAVDNVVESLMKNEISNTEID